MCVKLRICATLLKQCHLCKALWDVSGDWVKYLSTPWRFDLEQWDFAVWLLVPKWLLCVFLKRDCHTQQYLTFTQNGVKTEKHPLSSHSEGWSTLLTKDIKGQTDLGYGNTNDLSLQLWWAQKHLRQHSVLRQMGYNRRRPCQIALKLTKNKNLRLQWPQAHQIWTVCKKDEAVFFVSFCMSLTVSTVAL